MNVPRQPSAAPEPATDDRLERAVSLLDSDLPQAQALATAVLAEAGADSSAGGSAQHVLGTAECMLSRIAEGRALLMQAAETLQRHGPATAEMRAWRDYGSVLTILAGDAAGGIEAFQRALALAERLGLAADEGAILARIGPALMRAGRMEDAERQLQRAVALLQDGEDMHALATALDNLGWLLNRQEAFERALPLLQQEHRLRLEADERLHTVNCEGNLAITLAGLGRGDEACALLAGIGPRLDPEVDHFPWADYRVAQGSVCLLLGDAKSACEHFRAGLDVARRHQLHTLELDLLPQLSQAEERRGDLAGALACVRELRVAERQWLEQQANGRLQALEARMGLAEQRAQNAALQQARQELEQRVAERTAELREQVRERESAEALARYWADHDWLTRLPNRRRLQARLQEELATAIAQGSQLGLLFVDLDGFKAINDAHGHAVADRLLRRTAQRVRRHAGAGSFVARYGGDEFVVLLPGVASAQAAVLQAEALRRAVRAPMRLAGHQIEIGCSIGVAIGPRDDTPGELLLQRADRAMLEAKSAGRNQVLELDAQVERRLDRRGQLRRELGAAIQAQRLHAVYQPIWDLRQQRLGSVELLARWHDPQLGTVSPAEFIPLAEESGLIQPLGEWAVRQAVAAARALRADLPRSEPAGHRPRVSVNVSSLQLADPRWVETMLSVVQAAGGRAEWIEIELTESAQLAEDPATQQRMRHLREAGFALAIDDFGAGYSSFSYLRRSYFDRIKIDRALVRDVAQSGESSAVVSSIILMAHRLGLAVVAEGIETPAQAAWLEQQGCDSLQGFGIARPMPLEQLLGWRPGWQLRALA